MAELTESGPAGGTGLSAPVFSGGERIPTPLPNRVTTDPGAAGCQTLLTVPSSLSAASAGRPEVLLRSPVSKRLRLKFVSVNGMDWNVWPFW